MAESSRLLAFSLLGDLEVTSGGEPVALGGAKQRTLLALLLLARGRPVSSDTLIESLFEITKRFAHRVRREAMIPTIDWRRASSLIGL